MDGPHEVSLLEALWILGIYGAEPEVRGRADRERAFAEQVAAARGTRQASDDVAAEVARLAAAVTSRGRTRVKLRGTRLVIERDGERRLHELGAMHNLGIEHAFTVVAAALRPEEDVMALVPGGDSYVVLSRVERKVLRHHFAGDFERLFRKLPRRAPPRLVGLEPAPRAPNRLPPPSPFPVLRFRVARRVMPSRVVLGGRTR